MARLLGGSRRAVFGLFVGALLGAGAGYGFGAVDGLFAGILAGAATGVILARLTR